MTHEDRTEEFLKKNVWTGHSWVPTEDYHTEDVRKVITERNGTHGEYTFQAFRNQDIQNCFRNSPGWDELSDVQRDALQMISVKISRILTGDPNHKDSWVDIAGYATLAADRIE